MEIGGRGTFGPRAFLAEARSWTGESLGERSAMRAAAVHQVNEALCIEDLPTSESFEQLEKGEVDARLVFDFC